MLFFSRILDQFFFLIAARVSSINDLYSEVFFEDYVDSTLNICRLTFGSVISIFFCVGCKDFSRFSIISKFGACLE